MSKLTDIATGFCASCTHQDSVFKKTFDMAGHGITKASTQSLSMDNGLNAGMSPEM